MEHSFHEHSEHPPVPYHRDSGRPEWRPGEQLTRKSFQSEERRFTSMMRTLRSIYRKSPEHKTMAHLKRERTIKKLVGYLAAPMAGIRWEEFSLSGMKSGWARPSRAHDQRHVILYCHGGGYNSGDLSYSRILASKLAHATGYEVMSFEYRLAPEDPYPAAIEDAVKAWNHLAYLGYGAHDVIVAGDSAGGNLALVLCQKLREAGRQLPMALVLMSPWTDMTASGRSYTEREKVDPILSTKYILSVRQEYAPHHQDRLAEPSLSPLFGDLSGFPPTLIQVGDHEILLSDSVRLRDRMMHTGVPCRLEVWRGMWHDFQMFPMPKADRAMKNVGRFLLEHF